MDTLSKKCEWAKMTSDCAMSSPSVEHFRQNGVYVSACWLPYDETNAYKVYFVSGTNGDEFGQFADVASALTKARAMAKYSEQDRRQFDL